eukprot:g160.t1
MQVSNMILLPVLIFASTVSAGDRPHRWRHLDTRSRSPPRSLREAKLLHVDGREAMHRAGAGVGGGRARRSAPAAPPAWLAARRQREELAIDIEGSAAARLIYPADFGADPTGATDSTAAFQRAVAALLNHTASPTPPMADAIVNLGGATLDLAGGEYLLSAPIVIPKLVGNVRVRGGSLRASARFPPDAFLVEVGEEGCNAEVPQGVCNEMVGFDNIFLDAAHVGAGGIRVANTMGTTIGPSAFFTGFSAAGVRVLQGHETIVTDSWFAEYYWSDKGGTGNSTSVGVDLHGQDNYLTNVIVFDFTRVGVSVDGAATLLDGVHTWNGGGVGVLINGSYAIQDRLLGCYLDYNTLTIVDPTQTTIEDTFFLDTNAVLLKSRKPDMQSVVFSSNVYAFGKWGKPPSIALQPTRAAWAAGACGAVRVEDELPARPCTEADAWACGVKGTVARSSVPLAGNNTAAVAVDFSAQLLLPRIDHVQATRTCGTGSGSKAACGAGTPVLRVDGATVTAVYESAATWGGTLHLEVRQCL